MKIKTHIKGDLYNHFMDGDDIDEIKITLPNGVIIKLESFNMTNSFFITMDSHSKDLLKINKLQEGEFQLIVY